jgi:hypothetical protein
MTFRELCNEKFRHVIESSGIRGAGHEAHVLYDEAHVLYDRLMMKFVRKIRSEKITLGDVRVV